ncbi:MAG: thioredoxin [Clostridia bacterium]|nr:thioredoxin [Clostridia bacterium]
MPILNITNENFETQVLQNEKTVLLDFWATWCGPCRMISPIVDEIAKENPQICVGKVNVDDEPALAQAFQISSIPTLVVLRGGKIMQQSVGLLSKSELLALLEVTK